MEKWIISLGNAWEGLFFLTAYFATAFIVGKSFLCKKRNVAPNDCDNPFIILIFGVDFITLLGILLGFSGCLSPRTVRYFFIAGFMAFVLIQPWYFKNIPCCLYSLFKKYALFLFPVLLTGFLLLGRALCYPADWDELTYHLALPYRWLKAGGLSVFVDNPYSAFPSASTINFYLLISAGGIITPRLFIWSLWIISIISIFILLKTSLKRREAGALSFAFGAAYAVLMASSSAYAEMFILIHIAAILFILRKLEDSGTVNNFQIIALGIFSGVASSAKLTGLVVGFAVFLYLISGNIVNLLRLKHRQTLLFIITFLLTATPFYLRPWLAADNPFYPYFPGIFNSSPAALETGMYHHAAGSVKYGIDGMAAFLNAPLLLCSSAGPYDGNFGWQFLILFLLFIISVRLLFKNRKLVPYFLILSTLYVFWFFTSQQSRFLIPFLFIMTFYSKYILEILNDRIRKIVFFSIIILTFISIPVIFIKSCLLSWETFFGRIRMIDYLYSSTGDGYLKACHIIDSKLSKNAKIMLIFENRGLYIHRNYVIGTPFFQEKYFTPSENFRNCSQITNTLKKEKITHVLIGLSANDPDRIPEYLDRSANFAKLLGDLIRREVLKTIWEGEGFGIYEFDPNYAAR